MNAAWTLDPQSEQPIPEGVAAWVGDRERVVLQHGFADDSVGMYWWARELSDTAFAGIEVSVDPLGRGSRCLTRGVIMQLADMAFATEDPRAVLRLLFHALAWGTDASQRGNRRRIEAFRGADAAKHVGLLRTAGVAAREGDREKAYSTLIRPGGGKIPGLGPAFFTKYLYFAGGMWPGPGNGRRCLILDARVAAALRKTDGAWSPSPPGRSSYNWYTRSYVAYCDLLDMWARQLTAQIGHDVRADEIERALFGGPRYGPCTEA